MHPILFTILGFYSNLGIIYDMICSNYYICKADTLITIQLFFILIFFGHKL